MAFWQKWLTSMFNFFKKKNDNTSNTPSKFIKGVLDFVSGINSIDEFALDDIEELLIKADLGVEFTSYLIDKIKEKNVKPNEFESFLKSEFEDILENSGNSKLNFDSQKLNIYFVAGINGAGKTTLIGKLAHKLKCEGNKVLIAAGDTFRAAAEEQLDIWAQRANVDIVRRDGIESAAVVYEAIEKAQNENYNVLIIDTAGRLQNKFNLIEELKKVKSVVDKKAPNALIETILVLDANLGQNGLNQAEVFTKNINVTSCAMTKMDGTAKGGIILSVAYKYKIPTKLLGIGEKIEDIQDFNSREYINSLFG